MKILIADKFEQAGLEQIRALGCEVVLDPELSGDELVQAVRESKCRVLIVRSTRVTAEAINAGRELGLIIRAGAGYNNIDLEAASAQSVFVSNCPGKNAVAVAELTFGLLLALDRRIVDNVVDLRRGVWAKKEYSKAPGLKDRKLGVIGVGQIGQAVIRRAKAFEMKVVAWSRSLTPSDADQLGVVRVDLPEEVAVGSDVVTVHLAATKDTEKFIGKNIFDEMRTGAYFINTSRSEVVDYDALAAAVKEKNIRVGLDVYEQEPGPSDDVFADPIMQLEGVVYGTHHIGASTDQAQDAISAETVAIVKQYLNTGKVLNCVNLSEGRLPSAVLSVRHRNKPGVLANVLSVVSRAGINVREMENVICEGEQGACAQVRLDQKPDPQLLERIQSSDPNVLGIALTTPK